MIRALTISEEILAAISPNSNLNHNKKANLIPGISLEQEETIAGINSRTNSKTKSPIQPRILLTILEALATLISPPSRAATSKNSKDRIKALLMISQVLVLSTTIATTVIEEIARISRNRKRVLLALMTLPFREIATVVPIKIIAATIIISIAIVAIVITIVCNSSSHNSKIGLLLRAKIKLSKGISSKDSSKIAKGI